MKTSIQEKEALLLISDSVALFTSFLIAILLGHQAHFTLNLLYDNGGGFVTLFLSTLIFFLIFDLYTLHKVPQRFVQQALTLGSGLLASSIASAFIFFFFREMVPRAVFIILYVSAFALIVLFRYLLNQRKLSPIQWRVLLVGDGKRSSEVAKLITSRHYLRTTIVGYVSRGNGSQALDKLPRLGNTQDLVSIAVEKGVDQVIVAVPTLDDELLRLLLECMQTKIKVSDFRKVIEEITGKVPIDHLNDNWFILALSTLDKRYFWYTKRLLDILLSCVGICLALPLFPLFALDQD